MLCTVLHISIAHAYSILLHTHRKRLSAHQRPRGKCKFHMAEYVKVLLNAIGEDWRGFLTFVFLKSTSNVGVTCTVGSLVLIAQLQSYTPTYYVSATSDVPGTCRSVGMLFSIVVKLEVSLACSLEG